MSLPFDPVALRLGSLQIHWYGIMYLVGFAAFWALGRLRAARSDDWSAAEVSDLLFYGALGAVLGGRIGYALFYNFSHYLAEPAALLRIWQGGMSFHGGLIGALAGCALFARRSGKRFFAVTDFAAPLVAVGLGAGRIGNFINGELWGRATDLPWGVLFPTDPQQLARHPTQLYEAGLEGALLFALLWLWSARPRPLMAVSGLFLLGYAAARFAVEFLRLPDAHLGYLAWEWMTMGQLLSVPMAVVGGALLYLAYRR